MSVDCEMTERGWKGFSQGWGRLEAGTLRCNADFCVGSWGQPVGPCALLTLSRPGGSHSGPAGARQCSPPCCPASAELFTLYCCFMRERGQLYSQGVIT